MISEVEFDLFRKKNTTHISIGSFVAIDRWLFLIYYARAWDTLLPHFEYALTRERSILYCVRSELKLEIYRIFRFRINISFTLSILSLIIRCKNNIIFVIHRVVLYIVTSLLFTIPFIMIIHF